MVNVRFIKYPTGYQFRLYSEPFGIDDKVERDEFGYEEAKVKNDLVDRFTGEILVSDFFVRKEFDENVWYSVGQDVTFENLPDLVLAQEEAEKERKRAESLRVSLSRSRNNLYYIARSNVWNWFVTLTIAPDKMDRYDFKNCSKKVRKWFDNLRQRKCKDMYYLIVPEMHKDGAWHFHGLLGGCKGLSFVDSGHVTEEGEPIYNFEDWKYGFSTATAVTDSSRVSSYVCKYITKEMCEAVKGRQRYWVSQNVQRAEIFEGYMNPVQLEKFRKRLMDAMTWKKKHMTEYLDVEYFELPPDDSILD